MPEGGKDRFTVMGRTSHYSSLAPTIPRILAKLDPREFLTVGDVAATGMELDVEFLQHPLAYLFVRCHS